MGRTRTEDSAGTSGRLSVIIPTLNEAPGLLATLASVRPLRERGHEIILVDGGSTDDTLTLATGRVDLIVRAPRGRARQMNAGAARATGDVLLFLHGDVQLPALADSLVLTGMAIHRRRWGRFDVHLEPAYRRLRIIAATMNWRSRVTGIATGDQAIFVERALFARISGFPDIPLMEDVRLSKTLKRLGRPLCLREPVIASARRWVREGVTKTVMTMWCLRLAHACGASPARLHRHYYRNR